MQSSCRQPEPCGLLRDLHGHGGRSCRRDSLQCLSKSPAIPILTAVHPQAERVLVHGQVIPPHKGSSGSQESRSGAAVDSLPSTAIGADKADSTAAAEARCSELLAIMEELAGATQREVGQVRNNTSCPDASCSLRHQIIERRQRAPPPAHVDARHPDSVDGAALVSMYAVPS